MPTVAAGGGHILNIDFLFVALLKIKKNKKENKGKKLFLNKEKLRLLLKLWQIRRPNWRSKVQFPPLARRVARRVQAVRNCKATVH